MLLPVAGGRVPRRGAAKRDRRAAVAAARARVRAAAVSVVPRERERDAARDGDAEDDEQERDRQATPPPRRSGLGRGRGGPGTRPDPARSGGREHAGLPALLAEAHLLEARGSARAPNAVHRREAVAGLLRERAVDGGRDADGHVGPLLEHRRRRLVDVPHRDGDEVVARERDRAGQQLVEDDAERVHVGQLGDLTALRLLRRDVLGGAEHGAGLRHRRATSSERAIPKSVTFARPLPFRSTFCGFTSRWTSPCAWAYASAAGDLERDLERALDRRRPAALDQPLQVLAVDVLEDDELAPVLLAAVDHA